MIKIRLATKRLSVVAARGRNLLPHLFNQSQARYVRVGAMENDSSVNFTAKLIKPREAISPRGHARKGRRGVGVTPEISFRDTCSGVELGNLVLACRRHSADRPRGRPAD